MDKNSLHVYESKDLNLYYESLFSVDTPPQTDICINLNRHVRMFEGFYMYIAYKNKICIGVQQRKHRQHCVSSLYGILRTYVTQCTCPTS